MAKRSKTTKNYFLQKTSLLREPEIPSVIGKAARRGGSCSTDSLVVAKRFLRVNICGENSHLRQARNR